MSTVRLWSWLCVSDDALGPMPPLKTVSVFVPSCSMFCWTCKAEPLPTASSRITAPTPIRMPSVGQPGSEPVAWRCRAARNADLAWAHRTPSFRITSAVDGPVTMPARVSRRPRLVRDDDDRPAGLVQPVEHVEQLRRRWLSRLPVGSSASSNAGLVTSARAIATRCRWPPESSAGPRRRPGARRAPEPPGPDAVARSA